MYFKYAWIQTVIETNIKGLIIILYKYVQFVLIYVKVDCWFIDYNTQFKCYLLCVSVRLNVFR